MWNFILDLAKSTKLSDIHIHGDNYAAYREHGDVIKTDKIVTSEEIRTFLQENLSESDFSNLSTAKTTTLH